MGKAMWLEYLLTTSLEAVAVGEGLAFFVEVESDGGALDFAAGGLDVEAGFAVGGPAPGVFFAGFAGDDFDGVGDHEGGVEAYAELADEVGVLAGRRRKAGARKFLVPERAMVPRWATRSSEFMPMPVSARVRVFPVFVEREIDARGRRGSCL